MTMTATAHRLDRGTASLFDDIPILRRKWMAASRGDVLPLYEEVVLGSLGRLADRMVLCEGFRRQSFRILRAGRRIQEWIGGDVAGASIDELPPDCAGALAESLERAVELQQPAFSTAHRVREGMVETYELFALPLASRWGPPLIAAYIREQGPRYSLVDTIFRSTNEGILALATVRDAGGKPIDFQIVALNEGAARLVRRPEDELRWQRLSELDLGLDSKLVLNRLFATLETGRADEFEWTLAGDGEQHLKIGLASIGDLLAVTLTDIGEVKQREASFRLLFDANPVPMWLYDPDTLKFIGVNDAAVRHYGYSREQFLGMTLFDIRSQDQWDDLRAATRSFTGAYQSDRAWRHLTADGTEIEVLTYARAVSFGARPAIVVAIVDVTERKRAEARIAHMAHHDALTNLANRALFHQHLDGALPRMRRQGDGLAVHCLDLDHFKRVNDTLGHPVGDLLLKEVSERLKSCLRDTDLVARLGGDEFAVVQLPISGPHEASGLAGRLVEIIGRPYEIQGHDVIVGASIGIALAPSDGRASDVLLRNADMALYRAKAEGRGKFHFFEPEMDRRLQERRTLELDLRKAFSNGEFELFYQPLVTLRSNEVSGFEALLRWRSPERGMVSPAEFIPLAEEIGLIVPLGEWVLRHACAEAATWPPAIKVAVNLSPVQFKSRNLVQAVISALAYSGLPASRLELEITESVLLSENEANLAILHQLRGLGVRISMDDFGTGYSSLSYLRSFPFDKIKIDQSFVRDLAERPDCAAIIRAVTGLGLSLGIATTAEGVETREQLDRLRAEGCTEVQGYLFSGPQPASEVPRLLDTGRTRSVAAR